MHQPPDRTAHYHEGVRASRSFLLLGLLTVPPVLAQSVTSSSTPILTPVVYARYPHDRQAFTEGLQYLGNNQYVESTGIEGQSGVRRVSLKTGKVAAQVPTPIASAFGEGVSVLDGVLYHLTWQDGVAFAMDAETMQETGRYSYTGEGWGLTTDGKQLIMSNGSNTIVWRDPKSFKVTRSIAVTDQGQAVRNLNELEYVQGNLYANIWLTDRIARIDPQSGKVTAWISMTNLTREVSAAAARSGRPLTFNDVPNGIAYVPERGTLLLTGKNWPTMFEVRIPGVKIEPKPAPK